MTWTTPTTDQVFDAICPWCGDKGELGMSTMTYSCRCRCGAIAFGAPGYDYDEGVDETTVEFKLNAQKIGNRACEPRWWL